MRRILSILLLNILSIGTLSLYCQAQEGDNADENLCICYKAVGGADAWDNQANYSLNTALEKGRTYTLTLKAKASAACDMAFWPIDTRSSNKNQWGNSIDVQYLDNKNVTTEWATYTWNFTATYPHDRLDFEFGKLNGFLYIDDVKLSDDEYGVDLVQNGDFEAGNTDGWSSESGYRGTTFSLVKSDGSPVVGAHTGIEELEVAKESVKNTIYFNLQGQRVNEPSKGEIYIVNGKKVVKKKSPQVHRFI